MKTMIGIAVFSVMTGVAFAGDTFVLNGISGKDIPQAAGGMTVPAPAKQESVLTAQELAVADCLVKVELVEIVHPEIAGNILAELKEHCVASTKISPRAAASETAAKVPEAAEAEIISLELQAEVAAKVLKKDLKRLGIAARVSIFHLETLPPIPVLAVEFANYRGYDEALPLFDKGVNGRLYYKGVEVSPRVIKDITKTPNLWKQASFKAADGTVITVDYTPKSIGMDKLVAEPVWVTVLSPKMGIQKARAVIINYYDSSDQVKDIQIIDLAGVGSYTFKARAQSIELLEMNSGHVYAFRQEIAVVVDGKWLVDPVTSGTNFKFNLAMAGAGTPAVEKGGGKVPGPEKADGRYNYNDDYGGISESACPGGKIVKGSLVCAGVQDAYKLMGVMIDREYAVESLPAFVENADPVSLGLLPDDCTDTIFYYPYKLVLDGRTVGYAEIIGNANSEAGFRKKTTLKYNAAGKLAVVRIEDFGGTRARASGSLLP